MADIRPERLLLALLKFQKADWFRWLGRAEPRARRRRLPPPSLLLCLSVT